MRLTDDQLKAGLLHSSLVVRDTVSCLFTYSHLQHPDLVPLGLDAIERFGLAEMQIWIGNFARWTLRDDQSFARLWQVVSNLKPHSDETIKLNLVRMIAEADADVLERQRPLWKSQKVMVKQQAAFLDQRIRVAKMNPEQAWQYMEDYLADAMRERYFDHKSVELAKQLIDPLLRAPSFTVPKVLESLARQDPPSFGGKIEFWIAGMAIVLAGHLRLEEPIPSIWDRLKPDWVWYSQEVKYALCRIGTPAVIDIAAERLPSATLSERLYGGGVFEHIRDDRVVGVLRELLAKEDNQDVRAKYGVAAASQWSHEGAELALQVLNEFPEDEEREEIKARLVTYSYLSDWPLPQRDEWENDILDANAGMFDSEPLFDLDAILAAELSPALLPSPSRTSSAPVPMSTKTTPPVVSNRIGRNDPCPCGSGKKFKKCCLNG